MIRKNVHIEKIIHSERFEILKFTLQKGATIKAHTSPKDAFLQMLEGSIKFTIDEKSHQLKDRNSLAFPAHSMHEVTATEKTQFLIIR